MAITLSLRTDGAGTVDISLLGDKALSKKLRRLETKVQKKIVRKALRAGARPILASAKALVPYSEGLRRRSGKHLRDTLKLRALKARKGRFGVQVLTGTREELGIAANESGYYPLSLEYGGGNAPAQPYLRPALDMNRVRSTRIVHYTIRRGILQEARR